MQVNHDQKLLIAVGRSRRATQWQNKRIHVERVSGQARVHDPDP